MRSKTLLRLSTPPTLVLSAAPPKLTMDRVKRTWARAPLLRSVPSRSARLSRRRKRRRKP
eukprot:5941239-Pyramimonas_sp.AAC.1